MEFPYRFTGIYMILNVINGKFYIGSTIDLKHRIQIWMSKLKNGNGSSNLQIDWDLYGDNSFIIIELEECDKESLATKERQWINYSNPSYNIVKNSFRLSEETSNKIGIILKGNKNWLGRKHSEEAKRKISLSGKGRLFTEEHKNKISISKRGKPLSPQTIEASRIANTGRKHTEETKLKMSLAKLGNQYGKGNKRI